MHEVEDALLLNGDDTADRPITSSKDGRCLVEEGAEEVI